MTGWSGLGYRYNLKVQPTGGFFLARAEGQGPSGLKVTLLDGWTNGRTDGQWV